MISETVNVAQNDAAKRHQNSESKAFNPIGGNRSGTGGQTKAGREQAKIQEVDNNK